MKHDSYYIDGPVIEYDGGNSKNVQLSKELR
jgi:hypothetical protein